MVEAYPKLVLLSLTSHLHPCLSITILKNEYTLIFKLVTFLFLDISRVKRLFLKHDKFPFHCIKHIKFNLVNFMFWFCMNEEIFMVEERIYQKIRTIFNIVDLASWWLDKHILRNISFSFSQKNPTMKSFSKI